MQFLHLNPDFGYSKFEFCQLNLVKNYTNKLAINWQNFAQVGLQLKFALRIKAENEWKIITKLSRQYEVRRWTHKLNHFQQMI